LILVISKKFQIDEKVILDSDNSPEQESEFNESMDLHDLIERGLTRNDNPASFKSRIAMQFLNDYPIYNDDEE